MLTAPARAAEGRTTESGQAQSRLVITHLGVVVNDVAAAASGYASLVGVDPPAEQTSDPLTIAEVCHDPVVDLAGQEAFEAPVLTNRGVSAISTRHVR